MSKELRLPVYLDYNATTPVDPRVLETMLPTFTTNFGNPASTLHPYGWYAEELIKLARSQVASLINAKPNEIIFTGGATESINLAIKGAAINQGKGERFISQKSEHKAVLDTLEYLKKCGADVKLLNVTSDGSVLAEDLTSALNSDTRLVTIMLANNEIGTIYNIYELTKICKKAGALFHCDATQAVGKIPVDVKTLGVDLMSFSGHKNYAPKGVGVLYVKEEIHDELAPLIHGGGHEGGLRSGTLNVSGIVGLGKACSITRDELSQEIDVMRKLSKQLFEGLAKKLPGTKLNGQSLEKRLPGNVHVCLPGVSNSRLTSAVATKVAFSIASACQSKTKIPSHVLQAIGLSPDEQRSSIRLSVGRFTTEEEIAFAVDAISASALKQ